jgi:hypothetical protein
LHRAEINMNRERVAMSGSRGLQKFDSIPERIIDKNAVVTLERLVGAQRKSGCGQRRLERRQVIDDQRGMRFARRPKVGLDPEVDLEVTALEPATAAARKLRRLDGFRNSENA